MSQQQVIPNCAIEEMRILANSADNTAYITEGIAANILTVQPNRATRGVPEAKGQPDQCALARAAGADDRNTTARTNGKGNSLQYFALIRLIGKIDIVKLKRVPARRWQGSGGFEHLGHYIDHTEQSLGRGQRVAEELKGLAQGLNGFKTGQDHQGQKGQVDAVDGLRGDERNSQDKYGP